MAKGVWLSTAVTYVRSLEASVRFYRQVLELEVIDSSPTAALLGASDGAQLVLRAAGPNASHALGALGVQYLVWGIGSQADLDRRTQVLRDLQAFKETRRNDGVVTVEGRDPDDLVLMLVYRPEASPALRELPARIYAW